MCICLLFNQIPFIHQDDHPFVVFFNERKNIQVLRFKSPLRIYHQDANIAAFNGTNGPHDRIELDIFCHLCLFPDPCRVDEVKIKPEILVVCMDRIPGRSRNGGDDVPFIAEEHIDQ